MRKSLIAAAAATSAAAFVLAAPGLAGAVDTTTTFTIDAGGIGITASPTAELTVNQTTTSASGNIANVTVTDERRSLLAWAATVDATSFVNPAVGSSPVPAIRATYNPGSATKTGTVTPVPGSLTPLPLGDILPGPAYAGTLVAGNNTVSWSPAIAVNLVGSDLVSGTYTGTITHSVS